MATCYAMGTCLSGCWWKWSPTSWRIKVQEERNTKGRIVLAANYGYVTAVETTLKSLFYHTPRVTVYLANEDILAEWFRNINHHLAGPGSRLVDLKIALARLPLVKRLGPTSISMVT